ncbi:hypothetical protein SODALDRAFT_322818 [Sodiomyces alkalinus F11]|uniref:Meiotically up-regulated 65 protein n=1 Tax=Sodiomyces alkalinus (strain CBS 110278 / VKM F-3762 / F11) TaxID=1314773 RepID=A0A3N2Q4W8_SODAK|nr:hypothetical protein SODALDRAFT_322818 [Sodiomyces alkalinus F11]ROT41746.1 hypothetical protein SODALDRAFT_322818 [Sodiomyces alkalinus F11]
MPHLSLRTSRRVEGLKDSDYDHEISLLDQETGQATSPAPLSTDRQESAGPGGTQQTSTEGTPPFQEEGVGVREGRGVSAGFPSSPVDNADDAVSRPAEGTGQTRDAQVVQGHDEQRLDPQETAQKGPPIEIQGPTPLDRTETQEANGTVQYPRPRKPEEQESAIDILWENERGCFLCGTALFSSAALGNLDPSPWMNQYHKTSPTNIRTAQVPDPSWEWVWPEWRINLEEGVAVDEFGWEYSFMFHRKFSWHGPKWWNSFVRRRAWIRKRVKKKAEDVPSDPHMLHTDYFDIAPARSRSRSRSRSPSTVTRPASNASWQSRASVYSKAGGSAVSKGESQPEKRPDIQDIDMLLMVLRGARIDREKIEAVENYLENAQDGLERLEPEMHHIMGVFVFQASRRLLLGRLTQVHDEMGKLEEQDETGGLRVKRERLDAAIKHADEEVKRLSYWSDIKGMAEGGESQGAVEMREGWGRDWEGLDQSGPGHVVDSGKLP